MAERDKPPADLVSKAAKALKRPEDASKLHHQTDGGRDS